MRHLAILLLPLFFACENKTHDAPISLPENTQQLVLIITPDDTATVGQLSRFEREAESDWQPVGTAHPVTVGRSGLAWGTGEHPAQTGHQKKEGDGKAPAGIFRLTSVFGYESPTDFSLKMPFAHATEVLECVDDSNSKFYNQLVDSLHVAKDWTSSEFMRRSDHQYRWGVTVAHNAANFPQGGSCIFLHIWKEPGVATSGCTAMAEANLLALIQWLDEAKAPVLVQLTVENYGKFKIATLSNLPRN